MPKQARLNGIKGIRCYTIEEAAAVSGVSARTVRAWARDGLRTMNAERPILIRGDDLREYIKSKRASRKIQTSIDTFFCLPCRRERRAAEGLADCTIAGERATLTALCEACETVVFKPIAKAHISDAARTLDLRITRS
ncbi:MAG: helix-turn-helix domain-containing protein [Devosiaceae bacterium]